MKTLVFYSAFLFAQCLLLNSKAAGDTGAQTNIRKNKTLADQGAATVHGIFNQSQKTNINAFEFAQSRDRETTQRTTAPVNARNALRGKNEEIRPLTSEYDEFDKREDAGSEADSREDSASFSNTVSDEKSVNGNNRSLSQSKPTDNAQNTEEWTTAGPPSQESVRTLDRILVEEEAKLQDTSLKDASPSQPFSNHDLLDGGPNSTGKLRRKASLLSYLELQNASLSYLHRFFDRRRRKRAECAWLSPFPPTPPGCLCYGCKLNALSMGGDFVNAALNKPTAAIDHWLGHKPVCALTDGDERNACREHCMHTKAYTQHPWVYVDLVDTYSIKEIRLHRRNYDTNSYAPEYDADRVRSTNVYVDWELCFKAIPDNDRSSKTRNWLSSTAKYKLTCIKTLTGRYILAERHAPAHDFYKQLVLCEIKVKVCKKGYYGDTSCTVCPSWKDCKFRCNNLFGCDQLVLYNLAFKRPASISRLGFGHQVNAVDGKIKLEWGDGRKYTDICVGVKPSQDPNKQSWWQVDLRERAYVSYVRVYNRIDCCGENLKKFDVYIEDYKQTLNGKPTRKFATYFKGGAAPGPATGTFLDIRSNDQTKNWYGRYVILQAHRGEKLEICEVKVYGSHFVKEVPVGEACLGTQILRPCKYDVPCLNGSCTVPEGESKFLVDGTVCQGGTCVGGPCSVGNDVCTLQKSTCSKNDPEGDTEFRCRIVPAQTCEGKFQELCGPSSKCEDGICRQRLGSSCAGPLKDFCVFDTICDDDDLCKYQPGHQCEGDEDCIGKSLCDPTKVCKLRTGENCAGREYFCISGASCTVQAGSEPQCQCTDSPYVQETETCDPVESAADQPCDDSTPCLIETSICFLGKCECANGTSLDLAQYSCGLGVNADCTDDPDGCNSGLVCDKSGICLLAAGNLCVDNLRGSCRTGLVCVDGFCKLSVFGNCEGLVHHCRKGTVCDGLNTCKLPANSSCANDRVCVTGAACVEDKCKCIDGVSVLSADGQLCEAAEGIVTGNCGSGNSCKDKNAKCGTDSLKCECSSDFSVQSNTLSCMKAVGSECSEGASNCITGSECDKASNKCLFKIGEKCQKTDECKTGQVCDTDSLCRIDADGVCDGTHRSFCRSGYFCDWQDVCKVGKGSACQNDKECVAGALCVDGVCDCSDVHAKGYGLICEPKELRAGSDCEIGVCDEEYGTECLDGVCECIGGKPARRDFTCDYQKQSASKKKFLSTNAIIGIIIGLAAALTLLCCITFFLCRRAKEKRKDVTKSGRATLQDLAALNAQVDLLEGAKGEEPRVAEESSAASEASEASEGASNSEAASENN